MTKIQIEHKSLLSESCGSMNSNIPFPIQPNNCIICFSLNKHVSSILSIYISKLMKNSIFTPSFNDIASSIIVSSKLSFALKIRNSLCVNEKINSSIIMYETMIYVQRFCNNLL